MLELSYRQTKRFWWRRYREAGSAGLKHGNAGRPSNQGKPGKLLAELEIELWLGDAAVIRAKRGRRKPKTDRQDAQHILHLMLENDFRKIWIPSIAGEKTWYL